MKLDEIKGGDLSGLVALGLLQIVGKGRGTRYVLKTSRE
jgi:hypothetical protein